MNTERQDDVIAQVQDLTRQMAALVVDQEWEHLHEIERQRETLIKSLFVDPVSMENSEQLSELIQDLLASDKLLVELAIEAKDKLYNEAKSLLDSKRAFDAYAKAVRE